MLHKTDPALHPVFKIAVTRYPRLGHKKDDVIREIHGENGAFNECTIRRKISSVQTK